MLKNDSFEKGGSFGKYNAPGASSRERNNVGLGLNSLHIFKEKQMMYDLLQNVLWKSLKTTI